MSASLAHATIECHSVFSCFCPSFPVHCLEVASRKFATRCPPGVVRSSGSDPRLPTRMTLFTPATVYPQFENGLCRGFPRRYVPEPLAVKDAATSLGSGTHPRRCSEAIDCTTVGPVLSAIRRRQKTGAWRSPVAHLPWAQGVGGSNPLAPICGRRPPTLPERVRSRRGPVAQSDRATDF